MLALAGIPGTVGFIGKFQLIHALVDGGYTWLAIVLVLGSMISLGYYLRVIAAVWMRAETPSPGAGFAARFAFGSGTGAGNLAPIAGGSPEADAPGAGPGGSMGAGSSVSSGSVGSGSGGAGSAGSGGAGAGGAGRSEHPAARAAAAGYPEVTLVAVVFSAATIVFGVFPSPMFTLVAHAGRALGLH
jgi:NADH:ubiquinone oxidoreductase subunit 5 (subunit L)/multisubunit Na+/H+ antiporter MnhA subunit